MLMKNAFGLKARPAAGAAAARQMARQAAARHSRRSGGDSGRPAAAWAALAVIGLAALALLSLFAGAAHLSPAQLWAGDPQAWEILRLTRLPRLLALLLAGGALAVCGAIMQLLTRNRFVEPSTAGTADSAAAGLLCAMLLAPGLPLFGKMLVAALFATAGTGLFMLILRRAPLRSPLTVPLIGIMLGGIIRAATDFFAYRYDLLQPLQAWTSGDFSSVMEGRYELLWLAAPLALFAYIAADRFTAAGLGEDFSENIGVPYRRIMLLGLGIVAAATAVIMATIGQIPFLGLIAPNIVALKMGDNLRRGLPYIALLGAGLALACDIAGRLIRFPYEIPLSAIMGVVGSALFLYLLLSGRARRA